MGLQINEAMTKYISWKSNKKLKVQIDERKIYKFEEVKTFRYIGAIFSRKLGTEKEIQARIIIGNKCVWALKNLINNKLISRKKQLYETVIKPIVLFGSEP